MSLTIEQALDAVYISLEQGNAGIDDCIADLKTALHAAGKKQVEVNPTKLAQNNRQGRKMMQSYFKKRGVSVVFS